MYGPSGHTILVNCEFTIYISNYPSVENSVLKDGDSYHTIRVRLSTNFKRLKYVEIVQNGHQQELEELTNGMD